jgi:hypothetical protein
MITTAGKTIIKQFFGGETGRIGGAIALGVGATAATLADSRLSFEATRAQVTAVSSDLANNRIVFKATIKPGLIGTIYEAGLYQAVSGIDRSKALSLLSRNAWTNGTMVTTNARIGVNTVKVDAAASQTTTASVTNLSQNLAGFSGADTVAVAFFASANVSAVKLRLGNDASNYYQWNFATPAAGYNIVRGTFTSATIVGAPNIASINYAAFVPTATAGGAASVYLDGVNVEDNTSVFDNFLVVRNVLTVPKVIDTSIPTDIELSLGITV